MAEKTQYCIILQLKINKERRRKKKKEMEAGDKDMSQILQSITGHVRDFGHHSHDKRNKPAFNSTKRLHYSTA